MIFKDRTDAGIRLAHRLSSYSGQKDVIVLGIPRGGVPVAYEVARTLHAPLDIFLAHKLGVPGHEELAFGALAAEDGCFLDRGVIAASGITPAQIEQTKQAIRKKLEGQTLLFRKDRPAPAVAGKTVILIDDGIATGASVYAALQALRQMNPGKLILAAPVGPATNCDWLRKAADDLVVLHAPILFYAVGEFYERFPQVSDEEVIHLLKQAQGEFTGDSLSIGTAC